MANHILLDVPLGGQMVNRWGDVKDFLRGIAGAALSDGIHHEIHSTQRSVSSAPGRTPCPPLLFVIQMVFVKLYRILFLPVDRHKSLWSPSEGNPQNQGDAISDSGMP